MTKDLIVLVADGQQEITLKTLLTERRQSMGIQNITFDVFRHPRRDPGVFHEADKFLDLFMPPAYAHAIVLLDREWEGSPGDAQHQRQLIVQRMQLSGWPEDTFEVIVIDPELEAWIWSTSEEVATVLRLSWQEIKEIAHSKGYWPAGWAKPTRPKELFTEILRQQRRSSSDAIFQALARKVGLTRCQDPAFLLLCNRLRDWFSL
ncbi:methylation-associated defense system protein MAD4 [Gloeobacter kilaueensis]|uniref:DUF4276 domain-containing protein n=1 Tax=Gloeobacter kilaueensis (strain ATCC BAA-2537 / CCAP 1431/1 / ULC 316 / JS1) TaxID=1183438 RepID=U5QPB2_GLOK1|nr:hypothetical protein [Gloeobacter kilaueensis]AGY59500.1 hypothetical protein GKIL_3254 [Gloeobacter kilaueensis JS1]